MGEVLSCGHVRPPLGISITMEDTPAPIDHIARINELETTVATLTRERDQKLNAERLAAIPLNDLKATVAGFSRRIEQIVEDGSFDASNLNDLAGQYREALAEIDRRASA
jgi:hypothetical protein